LVGSDDGRTAPFDADSSGPRYDGPDFGDEPTQTGSRERGGSRFDSTAQDDRSSAPALAPFADLPSLPDDLNEAFESIKLAILRHKTSGWHDVSCADVLRSLDSLKALATAPA
jgi:hypothetical protein